jgi:hypothetical protein
MVPVEIPCLAPVCQPRCPELFCNWVLKSSVNAASEVWYMCEICETKDLALVEDRGGGVRACAVTVPLIKLHL